MGQTGRTMVPTVKKPAERGKRPHLPSCSHVTLRKGPGTPERQFLLLGSGHSDTHVGANGGNVPGRQKGSVSGSHYCHHYSEHPEHPWVKSLSACPCLLGLHAAVCLHLTALLQCSRPGCQCPLPPLLLMII
jgi:hypothetical protein